MLIKIKKRISNEVIFELDKENNTFKETVEEAVRQCVDLNNADFSLRTLKDADLHGAKLNRADITGTDLRGADLRGADLCWAKLEGSYLSGADLTGANIEGCDFDEAILKDAIMPDFPMACPEKGSFIAYKMVFHTKEYNFKNFIVKLEIPEDAKRCSATTSKCRCSKAKVLEIKDIDSGETIDEVTNTFIKPCVYKVGEMVYPDSFDECRWYECSNGIHFFMTEQEVSLYCTLTR